MTKLPISALRRRTKERPLRIERSTGSCSATAAAGCGLIAAAAKAMPRQLTASTE